MPVVVAEIVKYILLFIFGQQAISLLQPNTRVTGPGEKGPAPSLAEVAKDAVNTPSSVWGLAALGFVGVFLISQLRAAGSELAQGTRGVYREAQSTTRSLHGAAK
jgi:hypothetical protein